MKMLESLNGGQGYDLRGKHAVVIGRSNIVGKPMALMLLQQNATVTVCHSGTANLKAMTLQADVIVAAVGKRNVLTADMVKPGAVVIDVGMNRNDDGKLCGDVDFAGVKEVASYITPVPGGVGPMTITMLLVNTLKPLNGLDDRGWYPLSWLAAVSTAITASWQTATGPSTWHCPSHAKNAGCHRWNGR